MTASDVLTSVRKLLNDSDTNKRYSDAQLLRALDSAQRTLFNDLGVDNALDLQSLTDGQSLYNITDATAMTAQDVITAARDLINDPDGLKYSDSDLVDLVNESQKLIFNEMGIDNSILLIGLREGQSRYRYPYSFYDVLIKYGVIADYDEGDTYFNSTTGVWTGNLNLSLSDITNTELDTFLVVTEVTGVLGFAFCSNLTNTNGLGNLTTAGNITFSSAPIENVDGLISLSTVDGQLVFEGATFSDLEGLSSLSSADALVLQNCPNVTNASLAALSGLTVTDLYLNGTTPADCTQTYITVTGSCYN